MAAEPASEETFDVTSGHETDRAAEWMMRRILETVREAGGAG